MIIIWNTSIQYGKSGYVWHCFNLLAGQKIPSVLCYFQEHVNLNTEKEINSMFMQDNNLSEQNCLFLKFLSWCSVRKESLLTKNNLLVNAGFVFAFCFFFLLDITSIYLGGSTVRWAKTIIFVSERLCALTTIEPLSSVQSASCHLLEVRNRHWGFFLMEKTLLMVTCLWYLFLLTLVGICINQVILVKHACHEHST